LAEASASRLKQTHRAGIINVAIRRAGVRRAGTNRRVVMPDGLFANPLHWAILIVIVLIIFGPGKLPGVGNALGHSLREFRKASQSDLTPDQPHAAASAGTAAEPSAAPLAARTVCPKCGGQNDPEAGFCGECGNSLSTSAAPQAPAASEEPKATLCAACQTENPSTNKFCAHCGRLLDAIMDRV